MMIAEGSDKDNTKKVVDEHKKNAGRYFKMGTEIVCEAKTNPAASLYYYQSLLHGYGG